MSSFDDWLSRRTFADWVLMIIGAVIFWYVLAALDIVESPIKTLTCDAKCRAEERARVDAAVNRIMNSPAFKEAVRCAEIRHNLPPSKRPFECW